MVELIRYASNSIFTKNPIRRIFPNPVTYMNMCKSPQASVLHGTFFIKPRRMREGYGMSYIPGLYVQSEAIYSFLYCVDFTEKVQFGRLSYGITCLPALATRLFLDEKYTNGS